MNPLLRDHVTRTGFDLSISRTQIEALIWLNETGGISYRQVREKVGLRSPSTYVMGIGGCQRRGLVVHHWDKVIGAVHIEDQALGDFYTITRAGELVIDLLKESGLYDEHRAGLLGALVLPRRRARKRAS